MRPNTVEEWFPDGLRFIRRKYTGLSAIERDELESRFALAVARRRFNAERDSAYWWLCLTARNVYAQWVAERRRSHDALDHPHFAFIEGSPRDRKGVADLRESAEEQSGE
jgi:hypothetical protein